MVDTEVAKSEPEVKFVTVQLINHGINDSIGEHTLFTSFGMYTFINGELTVTPEIAKKLKGGGFIL